ncbi:MAG: FAD:protein FMN transferase [Pirellulaceae bacterium]
MGPIEYQIQIVDDDVDIEIAQKQVSEVLELVNSRMSTYIADSEVSRFNQYNNTDWFSVSENTAEVVQRAQEISEMTDGAFDITVKPLVQRWNFGPDKSKFVMPTEQEIASLLENVGYEKLHVRLDSPALKKDIPELQIDLSAIAKGYAVDRVVEVLKSLGVENYFVVIGGEISVGGRKSDNRPWIAGVERPSTGPQAPRCQGPFTGALATSGDYRNFFEFEGTNYSHEIDPSTGWPIKNRVTSASVVAPDCMTADALATAVMIMGTKRAQQLVAAEPSISVYTIERVGADLREWRSGKFPFEIPEDDEASIVGIFIATFIIFGLAVVAMAVGAIFLENPSRDLVVASPLKPVKTVKPPVRCAKNQ